MVTNRCSDGLERAHTDIYNSCIHHVITIQSKYTVAAPTSSLTTLLKLAQDHSSSVSVSPAPDMRHGTTTFDVVNVVCFHAVAMLAEAVEPLAGPQLTTLAQPGQHH